MRKMLLLIITVLMAVFVLQGCGTEKKEGTGEKTYVIATDSKFPPFSMEVNGKYEGIDVKILEAISKETGFKYELKPMDFSGIIPGLVSGQIDGAIAGMTITDERKKSVDFSDPYIQSALSIVANSKDTTLHDFADLKGKVAAVKKGTTGSKWAEDNKDKYGFTVTYFDDSPSTVLAVKNGNADFLLEDYPVISYETKVGAQQDLRIAIPKVDDNPPEYGFAVPKGKNAELLAKFNEGLKRIKANGEYDKIINEYTGK